MFRNDEVFPFPRGAPKSPFPNFRDRAAGVWAVLVCLAGTLLLACDDSPSGPGEESLHLEVLHGADQRGLPGLTLLDPIVVRVVDGQGSPSTGAEVGFESLDDGGSISTASELTLGGGLLTARWRLGEEGGRVRTMRAYLVQDPGGSAVTIQATAIRSDEADVVVFRKALGPVRGLVVATDDERGFIDIRQDRAAADTVVPLQPMEAGESDVIVFPSLNPPQRTTVHWTDGVDTAFVDLGPPFGLPLRINVFEGPYEDQVAIIQEHLARAQEVWDKEGMGLVFDDVMFLDKTAEGLNRNVYVTGESCLQTPYGDRIDVSYVHTINLGQYDGYGCGNLVFMSGHSAAYPYLLAHEIGHLFGLQHRAVGIMNPTSPGSTLTDGEVFMAHFSRTSILNLFFPYHSEAVQRTCFYILSGNPCLPADYNLPAEGGG